MRINIPNQITLGRLVLVIGFFALLSMFSADRFQTDRWLCETAFWVFLIAAIGDVIDGMLARAMHQVTAFGRVLDPVVDKVMVCGAFIFFSSKHFYEDATHTNLSGVAPWMVVVILTREMLVSAVRAHSESLGQNFAAVWAGKLKMFVQSTTICVILGVLAWYPDNRVWAIIAQSCVWATVVITALSILGYLQKARGLLLNPDSLAAAPEPASRTAAHDEAPTATAKRTNDATTGASA